MDNIKSLSPGTKKFFKRNYVDVLDIITPSTYKLEDLSLSGNEISPVDQVIKSHITFAANLSSILNVSTVGVFGSMFSSMVGKKEFFRKTNDFTKINTFEFESLVLDPLGKTLAGFNTSTDLADYLQNTFLPSIRLNNPTELFGQPDASSAHNYLLDTLSWLYILNVSGPSNLAYQPSAFVKNIILNKIYNGKDIELVDMMKGVNEFIWKNYSTCSLFGSLGLIPPQFLSGTSKYVSGTQQLDKLNTLTEIIYSPLRADIKDTRVEDNFDFYISTGKHILDETRKGPFSKFMRAISYSLADINDQVDGINLFYDIDRCPDNLLRELAYTIGWVLVGHEPDKWRNQLKNAVKIYKSKGTKKSLNLALDAIIGANGFNLSSQIVELYESYVPNILYYCLATASEKLQNFDSWTVIVAKDLGVENYSYNDMDTNYRFAVDHILEEAAKKYPNHFILGNRQFDLDDSDFIFKYRGIVNNLPPWEEEKFYTSCKISQRLLDFFEEKLLEFGVPSSIASAAVDYIKNNTLDASDNFLSKNSWLFFTESNQYPPNYTQILRNFDKAKVEYLPLWNGKSSSFALNLQANSFDYAKFEYTLNSVEGLKALTRTAVEFSPAHSIPLIDLSLSSLTDESEYLEYNCIKADLALSADNFQASSMLGGYESKALNMSSIGQAVRRTNVDSLSDTIYSSGVVLGGMDRTSVRRRNYKNLLPLDGWYDRTGFNMPGYFAASTIKNYNTYLPLGYIPSSGKYVSIENYISGIPSVYAKCENLNSLNSYNGVYTSATFPCRGASSFSASECVTYSTRADSDYIIPLLHRKIRERNYTLTASSIASGILDTSRYTSGIFKNKYDIIQSLANNTDSPLSIDEFYNFEFGRNLHKLYYIYAEKFGLSDLNRGKVRESGGFNLLSHTFGPLLYNGNFNVDGSASIQYPQIFTSSFDNEVKIQSVSGGILHRDAAASGTSQVKTRSEVFLSKFELRNPHILSGVELLQPSGDSAQNYFSVYKISTDNAEESKENYFIDNVFIKMKVKQSLGLPRVRFDLSSYGSTPNVLLPNHKFKLTIPYFIGSDSPQFYGNNSIGVWIRTGVEDDKFWSYTPRGVWEQTSIYDVKAGTVRQKLAHVFTYPITNVGLNNPAKSIKNLSRDDLRLAEVNFNTINALIKTPSYYSNTEGVHRTTQKYYVEVFVFPDSTGSTFGIIDSISMVDTTMNNLTTGYTEEEIQKIFLYFESLARGNASRVSSTTSSLFGANGGSRLDYGYHPKFGTYSQNANSAYTNIEITR